MSALDDRIAQFRKMTTDDPENELGHFRLGQLFMEDEDTAGLLHLSLAATFSASKCV